MPCILLLPSPTIFFRSKNFYGQPVHHCARKLRLITYISTAIPPSINPNRNKTDIFAKKSQSHDKITCIYLQCATPCDNLSKFSTQSLSVHQVNPDDDLRHCFFIWFNLNGLQVFLHLDVSQKRPEARACCSHSSNSSSSSSIISASKPQGYLLEFDRVVFSKPTIFTWKLGRWVLGLQAIPCNNLIGLDS